MSVGGLDAVEELIAAQGGQVGILQLSTDKLGGILIASGCGTVSWLGPCLHMQFRC